MFKIAQAVISLKLNKIAHEQINSIRKSAAKIMNTPYRFKKYTAISDILSKIKPEMKYI